METATKTYANKEAKLKELNAQRAKLKELEKELDIVEEKLEKDEELSKDDLKFAANLGWLSAAAVAISAVVNSLT